MRFIAIGTCYYSVEAQIIVACPLFLPELSDPSEGHCAGDLAAIIPVDTLRRCCNRGYARAVCERAAGSEADAMRFLVKSHRGGAVEVAWSIERNHHPVAVGSIKVTLATAEDASPLERQARVCAEAYLRQVGAAA
jgi:hypothetical protein